MTPEAEQIMKEWRDRLPVERDAAYDYLRSISKQIETFDLIANIAYYNHLHDSDTYSDFRGDKNFYYPEVLSLICLKNAYVTKSSIDEEEFDSIIPEIQKNLVTYCGRSSALQMLDNREEKDLFSAIAQSQARENTTIRNPGLPDHHLLFSQDLFKPLESDILSIFGFTIEQSIKLRKCVTRLCNKKITDALTSLWQKSAPYAAEIIEYKKTGIIRENSSFSKEQLDEYSKLSNNKIKKGLQNHFHFELIFHFGMVYGFTAEELAEFSDIDVEATTNFLDRFSVEFPALDENAEVYDADHILKKKPFLKHENRFLLPSTPLLTWAVEEMFEAEIKKNQKLHQKYVAIKHDFLLNNGLKYFQTLFPKGTFYPPNLYYTIDGKRCETDGIFLYDRFLFIVEAKGNRITAKAKAGHELSMKDYLNNVVVESYGQGIRALDFINKHKKCVFETSTRKKVNINTSDFDEVVIVTLTLEPIGNLTMHIKATNDSDIFQEQHFPWIISLYDLVIFADLIESPFLLIQYIKRRKQFLSNQNVSIYEELDLLGYFLSGGLYIKNTVKEAMSDGVSGIQFAPNTDEINDYYVFKFGHKTKHTDKPKSSIPTDLKKLLDDLEGSKLPYRSILAQYLLGFNNGSINQLMNWINKSKRLYNQDKELHDCTILSGELNGLGVTYMVASTKSELDFNLKNYCSFKKRQKKANAWIGLGDISGKVGHYEFTSILVLEDEKVEI